MVSEKNFFRIVGIDENSAKLLALVISKPNFKLNKLATALNLSKEDCDRLARKLASKETIEITSGGTIRITPNFALGAARKMETLTEEFAERLRATRFLIVEKFVEEIERIFQEVGYKIKLGLARKHLASTGSREFALSYRFLAEKFYQFGVFIFDPEVYSVMRHEGRYRAGRFLFDLSDLEQELGCLGTFVFFDPRLDDKSIFQIRRFLTAGTNVFRSQKRVRFRFIYEPEQNIRAFIQDSLMKIQIQRSVVEERFKELTEELKTTKDLVVEDSMMISQLNSIASGQYWPFSSKKRPGKFMVPMKSVVDREARNLEIFERKYEDEKGAIIRAMDGFGKRLTLPDPTGLKARLSRVKKLKSKFEPIRHELRSLTNLLLLPYIRGLEPVKINPFVLTEPNDIETFTINQDNIKTTANRFFEFLTSGGSNLLFVVGPAGSGKTHVSKHVFYSRAKELNVWPIYADCPMKYDIISSLFTEIVQERNFPQDVHHLLPSLRKRKVSTELEFVEVIKKLHDMMQSQGYKGLVLIIDELENSLPYTYDMRYDTEDSEKEEDPLALRQLKEILSSDLVRDTGFVIAFRDHILPEIKNKLKLKDFNSFLVNPEILNLEYFKELIELRCKTWKSTQIKFQLTVIREVISITNSNLRHTIQYFRALYQQASDEKKKTVTMRTLKRIGKIPLFSY